MKKISLLFVSSFVILSLYSCGESTLVYREEMEYIEVVNQQRLETLDSSNEITYYKGSPFSGVILDYYDNGKVMFEKSYKEGKRHGEWVGYNLSNEKTTFLFKDGKRIDLEFDLKDEVVKKYYDNGQLKISGTKINGKYDGEYEEYLKNGQLKVKTSYKDGKFNGKYEGYYLNGKLKEESNYIQGIYEGESKRYYDNGNLSELITYKNGKQEGLIERYYKNGQLMVKKTIINQNINGQFQEYYPDGQLKIETTYSNNKIDGLYKEYYPTGQLKLKTTYEYGVINGKYEFYEIGSGKLLYTRNYVDGKF